MAANCTTPLSITTASVAGSCTVTCTLWHTPFHPPHSTLRKLDTTGRWYGEPPWLGIVASIHDCGDDTVSAGRVWNAATEGVAISGAHASDRAVSAPQSLMAVPATRYRPTIGGEKVATTTLSVTTVVDATTRVESPM